MCTTKTLFLLSLVMASVASAETLVYFGTYTRRGESEGIYVSKLDTETGELSPPQLAAAMKTRPLSRCIPAGSTSTPFPKSANPKRWALLHSRSIETGR